MTKKPFMGKCLTRTNLNTVFEPIKRIDENGIEYWSARDLGEYLEYCNFQPTIERATV